MSNRVFANCIFAFSGVQTFPETYLEEKILQLGGILSKTLHEKVTHILTSPEMAGAISNPYRRQFFPNFESDMEVAMTFSIPLVDGRFVEECFKEKKLLDVGKFLIVDNNGANTSQSKLHPKVQELVKLLFDKSAQQQELMEMSLDSTKVASLTDQHLTQAYVILSEIEKQIQLKSVKKSQTDATKKLVELTANFYSLIPHLKQTPIDTQSTLNEKITTVQALSDIIVANKLMRDTRVGNYSVSPIDVNYRKLKTHLNPLDRRTREFQVISEMITQTRAAIHSHIDIQLDEVFEVEREGEKERFAPFESLRHHRLLFHGSRVSNFVGILSMGLRIAPPEAPVTGYFLGKGVYFADMISKSVEYCAPSKDKPIALMMICQVALGRPYQVAHSKYVSKEDLDQYSYHSVKGCGELGPDPAFDTTIEDQILVSLGKEARTGVIRSELSHNEFVVYDVSQIKVRYLVQLNVTSKNGQDIKAHSLVNAN